MKFLLDVNMPPVLAKALGRLGHSARHVSIAGFSKASDIELLDIARGENEVIITHDLDFGQLLAFSGYTTPSVIIFRIHKINAIIFERLLIEHWDLIAEPITTGSIVIIEEDKVRIKMLPI